MSLPLALRKFENTIEYEYVAKVNKISYCGFSAIILKKGVPKKSNEIFSKKKVVFFQMYKPAGGTTAPNYNKMTDPINNDFLDYDKVTKEEYIDFWIDNSENQIDGRHKGGSWGLDNCIPSEKSNWLPGLFIGDEITYVKKSFKEIERINVDAKNIRNGYKNKKINKDKKELGEYKNKGIKNYDLLIRQTDQIVSDTKMKTEAFNVVQFLKYRKAGSNKTQFSITNNDFHGIKIGFVTEQPMPQKAIDTLFLCKIDNEFFVKVLKRKDNYATDMQGKIGIGAGEHLEKMTSNIGEGTDNGKEVSSKSKEFNLAKLASQEEMGPVLISITDKEKYGINHSDNKVYQFPTDSRINKDPRYCKYVISREKSNSVSKIYFGYDRESSAYIFLDYHSYEIKNKNSKEKIIKNLQQSTNYNQHEIGKIDLVNLNELLNKFSPDKWGWRAHLLFLKYLQNFIKKLGSDYKINNYNSIEKYFTQESLLGKRESDYILYNKYDIFLEKYDKNLFNLNFKLYYDSYSESIKKYLTRIDTMIKFFNEKSNFTIDKIKKIIPLIYTLTKINGSISILSDEEKKEDVKYIQSLSYLLYFTKIDPISKNNKEIDLTNMNNIKNMEDNKVLDIINKDQSILLLFFYDQQKKFLVNKTYTSSENNSNLIKLEKELQMIHDVKSMILDDMEFTIDQNTKKIFLTKRNISQKINMINITQSIEKLSNLIKNKDISSLQEELITIKYQDKSRFFQFKKLYPFKEVVEYDKLSNIQKKLDIDILRIYMTYFKNSLLYTTLTIFNAIPISDTFLKTYYFTNIIENPLKNNSLTNKSSLSFGAVRRIDRPEKNGIKNNITGLNVSQLIKYFQALINKRNETRKQEMTGNYSSKLKPKTTTNVSKIINKTYKPGSLYVNSNIHEKKHEELSKFYNREILILNKEQQTQNSKQATKNENLYTSIANRIKKRREGEEYPSIFSKYSPPPKNLPIRLAKSPQNHHKKIN